MKILMAHNYYRESGGEDESFKGEVELLRVNAHSVTLYTRDNREINETSFAQSLQVARRTIWAEDSARDVRSLLQRERPQIAHFQNIFPLISPAVYQACRLEGVPVIQSLRNYRLLCANALFFRKNHTCEDCLASVIPLPGILHACYRDSAVQSGVVAGMLTVHRLIGTWKSKVDLYLALSEFSRQKFIEGGMLPEKIVVKPNFVIDRGERETTEDYVVFAGRLSKEKGLISLLNAWRSLPNVPLIIIGTGPLYGEILEKINKDGLDKVKVVGQKSNEDALNIIRRARFLVFPSEWYETFGRVVIEAYSAGVPVLASRIGAVTELVSDRGTGLLFDAGDSFDLATKAEWLWEHPDESAQMGHIARKTYEEHYTPEQNYRQLMDIYNRVIRLQKEQ